MKVLIYLTMLFFICSPPVMADDLSEVSSLVKDKIGFVIQLLKDEDLDKQIRNDQIIATVTPLLDFDRMARLSLGKRWKSISQEKQKEFTSLFVKRMRESYLEKLDLYSNEEVIYREAKQVKNRIHVATDLVYKGDKVDMVYKFYKSKQGWKGYDIEILGVSIIQTYRSQFNGILKNGSIDDLLEKLKVTGEFEISSEQK